MKYLFLLAILVLWLSTLAYSMLRINQTFDSYPIFRRVCIVAYIVLFVLFIVALFFEGRLPLAVEKPINFAGYSFLILSIYLFIAFLFVDVVRLVNHLFPFAANIAQIRVWLSLFFCVAIVGTMIAGYIRFTNPKIVELNIESSKTPQNKEIKMVVVSDIHLGVSIDKKRLAQYVALINAQHPDVVLIAGDLIDRVLRTVVTQQMDEELRQISAPMGVYAIFGNHEYYSRELPAVTDFYKKANIRLLQDSSVLIGGSIYVVGRDDKTNPDRETVSDLTESLDKSKPIILLDHQPYDLQDAVENGVDVQFSGHTHNGQFFPINWIVKGLFEKGYGYLKKGETHFYVTSGLGLWGPQYRIGTESELVVLRFKY